jgi:hypothetical protein
VFRRSYASVEGKRRIKASEVYSLEIYRSWDGETISPEGTGYMIMIYYSLRQDLLVCSGTYVFLNINLM